MIRMGILQELLVLLDNKKTNGDRSKGSTFWFLEKILMSSLVDITQTIKEKEPVFIHD